MTLRCPRCKEGEFKIIKQLRKNLYDNRSREKALFGCDKCDYREVI